MLKAFNAHLNELETRAERDELFVDYQCLTAAREYGAIMCTVSSKEGKRICRMAGNSDITVAQEEAGYMALCAFYSEAVRTDTKTQKPVAQQGTKAAPQSDTRHDSASVNQQGQTRPRQTGPAQAGQPSQRVTPQPAATENQQTQQKSAPPQPTATTNQQGQRQTGSAPVTPTARTQGRQISGTAQNPSAGNRTVGQTRPANPQSNATTPQQRTAVTNQHPAQRPSGATTQNVQKTQQSVNQPSMNQRPVPTAQMDASSGKRASDDFRVMIGNFKHAENNWISDLAANPQTLNILRGIAGVTNPADETMREPIQQVRQYLMNHQLM